MKKQSLLCSLLGLLATGTLSGLFFISPTQAQSSTYNNPHHPTNSSGGCCSQMGATQQQKDQQFIQKMIPHHQDAMVN